MRYAFDECERTVYESELPRNPMEKGTLLYRSATGEIIAPGDTVNIEFVEGPDSNVPPFESMDTRQDALNVFAFERNVNTNAIIIKLSGLSADRLYSVREFREEEIMSIKKVAPDQTGERGE